MNPEPIRIKAIGEKGEPVNLIFSDPEKLRAFALFLLAAASQLSDLQVL